MGRHIYRENEVIQKTQEVIRSFYGRLTETTIAPMTDTFMWIGANDFQWCEGLEEFLRITKKEYEATPVLLSDEEYHLLFHDRNVWVVYGRYKGIATLEDGSRIKVHVRITFVWRVIKGVLKLEHVHGSNSQDISLGLSPSPDSSFTEDSDFLGFMKKMADTERVCQKIPVRDCDKRHRYLFPSEILYLEADGQRCIFHTEDGSFPTPGLLSSYEKKMPEMFFRLHKSYLVNCLHIDSISRYRAILKNRCELPIGKERYMELKRKLAEFPKEDG